MKKVQCDVCGKQETHERHGAGLYGGCAVPSNWLHLSVSHPDPKRAGVHLDLCSQRCLVESMPAILGEIEKAPARRMPPGLHPDGAIVDDDPWGGGDLV